MSIEQKEEIQSLLWSYTDIIPEEKEEEKLQQVKTFFKINKIPIFELRTMFRGVDEKTHLSAVNIAVKIACGDILRVRPGMN